ncbi:MAG: copper homeostasis protein CutC [Sediminibacterium sp.]
MLEVAVFNIESAIQAEAAGANRLELCENPNEGGTTPSYGTLSVVSSIISIPVFPIIRPRGGDFLYSRSEFDVMKNDIRLCKELGFGGVVIGLLLPDGSIDKERTKELVQLAAPLEVTFHRAFDRCNDPIKGLHDIIETGCKRILTSGQVPSAPDALDLLQTLVKEAGDNIIIMPGSGVRGNNIATIKSVTKAKEFHSSARKVVPTNMEFTKESMQENLQNMLVDAADIKTMLTAIA